MKKKLVKLSGWVAGVGAGLVPVLAFAQNTTVCGVPSQNVDDIFKLICKIQNILNALIPFLVALGIVYFVWGVIQYVVASEEEAKKKGRDRMIFGIIGLVVIFAVWGIIRLVLNTLGTSNQGTIGVPCVPGSGC